MNSVLDVDREHRALQATIIFSFFIGAGVAYLLISYFFRFSNINLVAAVVALLVGFLLSKGLEWQLKDRWRSGRRLHLEPNRYFTTKNQKDEHSIKLKEVVELLFWRFSVKRAGRIPKGWYLLACALLQDGNYLPVYCFMPKEEYEQLPQPERFIALQPKKKLQSDDRLSFLGQQKRLHTAEVFRWNEGAELNREDFRHFLMRLDQDREKWPQ